MHQIDGNQGEGGGQILRSSLTLAAATGQAFTIDAIRAGRRRPGLLRQHLTCVRALQEITGSHVEGAELGSTRLTLHPGSARPGNYHFAVGSAGSCMLVLQTVILPLLLADGPSTVVVEGGTHNQAAPPYDAFAHGFVPLLRKLGAHVDVELERPGFFPVGGGRVRVQTYPVRDAQRVELLERGPSRGHRAVVHTAHLPADVGDKQRTLLAQKLPQTREIEHRDHPDSPGPATRSAPSCDLRT